MYQFLKGAHNIIGMVILLALLLAFIIVLIGFIQKKPFNGRTKTAALVGMILVHLQIVLGFILYFISPVGMGNFSGDAMKETVSRFYLVEHPVGMILAAVLITLGYNRTKKEKFSDGKKHQQVLIFYGIGLVILTYFIPWFIWS